MGSIYLWDTSLMSNLVSIDFEYHSAKNIHPTLVCANIRHKHNSINYWLHNSKDRNDWLALKSQIISHANAGDTFIAWNVVAEARCFIALGLNPLDYKWIDPYLEYRCLVNHNHNYMYGKQLKKGRKKFTVAPKPKWQRKTESDENKADASKPEYNYGAGVYKTLGIVIDNDFKDATRDLIISAPESFTKDQADQIMEYCASDTVHLVPAFMEMLKEYRRLLGNRYFNIKELKEEMFTRANYAVRTAIMEHKGYPIDVEKTRNFSDQVGNIIWNCQNDIVNQFEGIHEEPIFRAKVKKRPFELSWNQKFTKELVANWCKENNYKNWTLTDGKDLSLSLKAFSKAISYRHTYPEGNFIAQMQRYLKLKQGLNGFTGAGENGKSKGKKNFWDSVGTDGRVRPYMNIYGAQSSRSQPSATSFIPLKAAWQRSLIFPDKGRSMCGIDWSSQEYLVSALLAGDEVMILAYESGDVYLAFAKDCKIVPKSATKETHGKERDNMKPVILGQQYDLTKYGLSNQLTESQGKLVTPDEAEIWITRHKKLYKKLWAYKDKVQRDYRIHKFLKLPDGFYFWGDNDNFRSVGNVPTQGFSACIMRKAVELAQDAGLQVLYTLHDALYIEFDTVKENHHVRILAECMDKAFRYYFPNSIKDRATCRMEADIWGPDYGDNPQKSFIEYEANGKIMSMEVKQQRVYVDPRSKKDYDRFSKYFVEEQYDTLEF